MPSWVDPGLVDNSETDRLLAGVARLLYRHIAEGAEAVASAEPRARSSSMLPRVAAALPLEPSPSSRLREVNSADFDEELYLERKRCRCRCLLSRLTAFLGRRRVLADDIFSLLQLVAAISDFKKEVVVLSAIYIERLLHRNPNLYLTQLNWRPLLVAALHLASKTWEDVHAWNVDFLVYLDRVVGVHFPARKLHALEFKFLDGIDYRTVVGGELYFRYFSALLDADQPPTPPSNACAEDDIRRPQSCGPDGRWPCVFPPREGHEDEACVLSMRGLSDYDGGSSTAGSPPGCSANSSFVRQVSEPALRERLGSPSTRRSNYTHFNNSFAEDPRSRGRCLLDRRNPYLGSFRHAPRALPPSSHINRRRSDSSFKETLTVELERGRSPCLADTF